MIYTGYMDVYWLEVPDYKQQWSVKSKFMVQQKMKTIYIYIKLHTHIKQTVLETSKNTFSW